MSTLSTLSTQTCSSLETNPLLTTKDTKEHREPAFSR